MANLQGMPGRSLQGLYKNLQGFGGGAFIYFAISDRMGNYSTVYKYSLDGVQLDSVYYPTKLVLDVFCYQNKVYYNYVNSGVGEPNYIESYDKDLNFISSVSRTALVRPPHPIFIYKNEIYSCAPSISPGDNVVFVHDMSASYVRSWGTEGTGNNEYDFAYYVVVVNDLCIIADTILNSRIQVTDINGTFARTFGSQGTGDGKFEQTIPGLDVYRERVYCIDFEGEGIQVFDYTDGSFVFKFGYGVGGANYSGAFRAIKIYGGTVYIADATSSSIKLFSLDGVYKSSISVPAGLIDRIAIG